MPFTPMQSEFAEEHLGYVPEGRSTEPVDRAHTEEALALWNSALHQTLQPAAQLAKQLKADPDPLGAEISAFVVGCIEKLRTPIGKLSDAEALEQYLTSSEDIDILEA